MEQVIASATGVAVTGGDGSSATVDITASAGGAITNVTVNNGGTGFAAGNTITIANANATGVKTLGSISAAGSDIQQELPLQHQRPHLDLEQH
ncbi:MAG: hypothetical protein CM15mV28_0530 [Thaumasvirus sp.]|nr:MAG: hypothetical protein CM15mV28_0530 [Thaumasvirus sp.]